MTTNCESWREIASARFDGETTADESERLDRHIEGCPDCTRWVAEIQADRAQLAAWSDEAPRPVAEPRPSLAWRPWAAAAGIVLALGAGFLAGRASNPPPDTADTTVTVESDAPLHATFVEQSRVVYPSRNESYSEAVVRLDRSAR